MKDIVTYSLLDNKNESDNYYNIISSFTDEVIFRGEQVFFPLIDNYMVFLTTTQKEDIRSRNEYILEILDIGMLLNIYGSNAFGLSLYPARFLTLLSNLRVNNVMLKPSIGIPKGVLSTVFLGKSKKYSSFHGRHSLFQFDKLLNWLSATGEYQEEVNRFKTWHDYLLTKNVEEVSAIISKAVWMASWFESRSRKALGAFTINVEQFLYTQHQSHRYHEDYIFSGRKRVEYHLNMVGAEIMNRAFNKDFMSKANKKILLPYCMRLHQDSNCQAIKSQNCLKCTGCSKNCRVNQVTKFGEMHGIETMIICHESSLFSDKTENTSDVGIIGIACVTNLISGGLKSKRMGIPPQCVLLDYCGCKKHWHEKGIPTDINFKELVRIIGLDIREMAKLGINS